MLSNEASVAMPAAYPPSMMIPRATQVVQPPSRPADQQHQYDGLFDSTFAGSTSGGDGSLEALLGCYQPPSSLSASDKPAEDDVLAQVCLARCVRIADVRSS